MDLSRYHLTSRKNGGQWSGPCLFTGVGVDRFTIEPHPPGGGPPKWFCRGCNQCNRGTRRGNYRYGVIEDNQAARLISRRTKVKKRPRTNFTMEKVVALAASMNSVGLKYLESRGISAKSITKFKLGMMGGRSITIPLIYTWEGAQRCDAIKRRWLPQYRPNGSPKYMALPGSRAKAVFNFDMLREPAAFGIIGNSLFDVILLDQLGFTVAGPFSGEPDWEIKWSKYIKWDYILNMGDWDKERTNKITGETYRPGTSYMLQRATKLSYAPNVKKVINVYPPDNITDISAMQPVGIDIVSWVTEIMKETMNGQ
mgnify:CR=1 FL=1